MLMSCSVAASGPPASKVSQTFWIAARFGAGGAERFTASSSCESIGCRVSQDLAAPPDCNAAAKLSVDLAAGRASFVCPRSPHAHYLPKEPWLAETFESP